jgi:hypothetical protein
MAWPSFRGYRHTTCYPGKELVMSLMRQEKRCIILKSIVSVI